MKEITAIIDSGRWHNNSNDQPNNNYCIDIMLNGVSEKVKKNTEKYLLKKFRQGREELIIKKEKNNKKITIIELPKTPVDIQIINQTEWTVKKIKALFGGRLSPKLDINRYHLLRPGSVEIFSEGDINDGFFDLFSYCISINRSSSNFETVTNLQHEEIHKESPIIWQIVGEKILPMRFGASTFDKKGKSNLTETDEALTAELNYQLIKNTENNPLYKEELEKVKKIIPWVEEINRKKILGEITLEKIINVEDIYTVVGAKEVLEILESRKSKDYKFAYLTDVIENPTLDRYLVMFERSQEWTDFSNFSYTLITESGGKIKSRWQVIDMFARVKFATNDTFFEKRNALKQEVDKILGEGSFDELK